MTELICICCPKGCHLTVDETNDYAVKGNSCERGAEYGRAELLHPTRVVTSTVIAVNGVHPRCPVKTDRPIPKESMFAVMEALNDITVTAPISAGQVIVPNICGTGANIIACRPI